MASTFFNDHKHKTNTITPPPAGNSGFSQQSEQGGGGVGQVMISVMDCLRFTEQTVNSSEDMQPVVLSTHRANSCQFLGGYTTCSELSPASNANSQPVCFIWPQQWGNRVNKRDTNGHTAGNDRPKN
jgi:hypothetical protein